MRSRMFSLSAAGWLMPTSAAINAAFMPDELAAGRMRRRGKANEKKARNNYQKGKSCAFRRAAGMRYAATAMA
jgi:hypothetical protein